MDLGKNLKFCTSLAKGLKLKVRKFWGPNTTFVEVTGEKLVGEGGLFAPPPILNRANKVAVFSCEIWETFKNAIFLQNTSHGCFCHNTCG